MIASIGPSPAHSVAFDLRADGPAVFTMEPPAFHMHYWRENQGFVSHLCYVGEFDGPYPFFTEDGRLIE